MNFGNFKFFTYKGCEIYYNAYFVTVNQSKICFEAKIRWSQTSQKLYEFTIGGTFKPITEPLHELVRENKN